MTTRTPLWKKFRAAMAAGFVLALVIPAGPASAQTGCDIRLGGVSNGQTISGGVNLRATGASSTGVKRLELSISGSVVQSANYEGLQQNGSIDYGWNLSSQRNGEYTVKASGSCGNGSNSQTARVYVDNAPQTPSGVSANHADGTIHVSWNANSEPDLQGYRVERDGGSGWQSLGEVGGTSFADSPGAGTFSYRITALRFSPTQGTKASAPSGSASATVPAAADPGEPSGEPGTGAGSGSGSGSGAGSGSGSGGSGRGSGVPGYGGTGGGKNSSGKGSKGGSSSVGGYGGGFFGGRSIGGIGLPGALRLPGRGNASAPAPAAAQEGDGTYEPLLPYELDGSPEMGSKTTLESFGTAALSPFRVIPPDAARWVAAGLWFLVTAALLKFLERRVAAREQAEAAPAVTQLVPVEAPSEDEIAPDEVLVSEVPPATESADEAAPAARKKCAASTKAGNACRNYSITEAGFCRAHASHERSSVADISSEGTSLRLVKEGDAA